MSKNESNRGSENFENYLSQEGLKFSEKRAAVVDLFLKEDHHFSVEQLYEKIRRSKPGVSYSTVYRALRLLVKAGLATQRQFEGGSVRFEPVHPREHHDHLVCIKCWRVIEFKNLKIEKLQRQVGEKNNFKVIRHKFELYGYCENCAK